MALACVKLTKELASTQVSPLAWNLSCCEGSVVCPKNFAYLLKHGIWGSNSGPSAFRVKTLLIELLPSHPLTSSPTHLLQWAHQSTDNGPAILFHHAFAQCSLLLTKMDISVATCRFFRNFQKRDQDLFFFNFSFHLLHWIKVRLVVLH